MFFSQQHTTEDDSMLPNIAGFQDVSQALPWESDSWCLDTVSTNVSEIRSIVFWKMEKSGTIIVV